MTEQPGDANPGRFSFLDTPPLQVQRSCYLTYTNTNTHDILREGFEQSPLFTGRIQGSGPRYCPSIEDKIDRFSDRERHQLFIEPEGWDSNEYYVNGFSSSLPEDIQYRALRQVPGFENARIMKPGYAIEYDFFSPLQLHSSLESKKVQHLFLAGQVNGTTGYEEAAGQGLMAGINAHRLINGLDALVLKRHEAYIGVLIDDLVTKGTKEPYRMFTSRAEFRILLRQDNADARLTPIGYEIGLAGEERMRRLERKREMIDEIRHYMDNTNVAPDDINHYLVEAGTAPMERKMRIAQLLLRPQVSLQGLKGNVHSFHQFVHGYSGEVTYEEVLESVEILVKYAGYLEKEKEIADKISRLENMTLASNTNYQALVALSAEAREKLQQLQPGNIGQAARISGITPADISVLLVHLGR
jgi:tRNA uridine 5-carboxymethylaminomethyl modification enzyme